MIPMNCSTRDTAPAQVDPTKFGKAAESLLAGEGVRIEMLWTPSHMDAEKRSGRQDSRKTGTERARNNGHTKLDISISHQKNQPRHWDRAEQYEPADRLHLNRTSVRREEARLTPAVIQLKTNHFLHKAYQKN